MAYEKLCEALSNMLEVLKRERWILRYNPTSVYDRRLIRITTVIDDYKAAVGFVPSNPNDFDLAETMRPDKTIRGDSQTLELWIHHEMLWRRHGIRFPQPLTP